MAQTTPAAIAASLTEAQRRALLTSYDIGFGRITTLDTGRSAKALHRMGLTNLPWSPAGLTPLGLAVLAHLEKNDG